jgi:hypothetical protein
MTANNEDVKVKSREKICAYRELKLGGAVPIFTENPRRVGFSETRTAPVRKANPAIQFYR